MKLLVLAQTPPPVHGQSLAVRDLLEALRARHGKDIEHVQMRLSRESSEIGRWNAGKLLPLLGACFRVWMLFLRKGQMPIYYVPAPGKRAPLYRDWLVMLLCRPVTRGLILHWHAVGLNEWLTHSAAPPERWLTQLFLGRATLAIVQAEAGRGDALFLKAKHCVVVPNGVPPRSTAPARAHCSEHSLAVLFVGLGCAEKGIFDALDAVQTANSSGLRCHLRAIGPFASESDRQRFAEHPATRCRLAKHLGFVSESERDQLYATSDVFCFPSYYPHEGQPAVLLEALAHDLPIVTTRWRGIPENLPEKHVHLVAPRSPAALAAALAAIRAEGPPHGYLRAHHQNNFTKELHHERVIHALESVVKD